MSQSDSTTGVIVITKADFYLKQRGSRTFPASATLLLTYVAHLDMGFEDVRSVYLHSRGGVHEVWQETGYGSRGRLFAYRGPAWSPEVSREIIRTLVRERSPFEVAGALVRPGLVHAEEWGAQVEEFAQEIAANHRAAREAIAGTPSPIIDTARELGLGPVPHGSSATDWQAGCPGTNHPLYISTISNEWGCGWCRRKGGGDELRAFVRERRLSRASRLRGRK